MSAVQVRGAGGHVRGPDEEAVHRPRPPPARHRQPPPGHGGPGLPGTLPASQPRTQSAGHLLFWSLHTILNCAKKWDWDFIIPIYGFLYYFRSVKLSLNRHIQPSSEWIFSIFIYLFSS